MVLPKVLKRSVFPTLSVLLVTAISCCTPVSNMTRNGEYYLMSGNYYKAIDTYTHAINLNPNDAAAYLGRAMAFEELGRLDQALKDFNAAVILLPNDSGVYLDRGILYELRGNYELALKDYSWAIQLDPSNANAYFHRGNAYMNLGDTSQAFDSYRMAARLGHVESQNILRSKGVQ